MKGQLFKDTSDNDKLKIMWEDGSVQDLYSLSKEQLIGIINLLSLNVRLLVDK